MSVARDRRRRSVVRQTLNQEYSLWGDSRVAIRCTCTSCGVQFKIDDKYAGRKARCPKCSHIMQVPTRSASEEVATFPTVSEATGAGSAPPASSPANAPPLVQPAKTVDTDESPSPGAFPNIDTNASSSGVSAIPTGAPSTSSPGTSSFGNRRPKKKSKGPVIAIGTAAGGVIALVVIVAIVVSSSGDNGNESAKGGNGKDLDANATALRLDWPDSERKNARVLIDGKNQVIPASGDVSFALAPGTHKLVIQRRGYDQFEQSFSLKSGDQHLIAPTWIKAPTFGATSIGGGSTGSGIAGFEDWMQDLVQAKRVAAEENKDILLAFVGSDWDANSQALQRQVFADAQFQQHSADNYVNVVIDFPKTQIGYDQLEDPLANSWTQRQYSITSDRIPSIVLADAEGRPYFVKRGYDGGGSRYVADLIRHAGDREVRDNLFLAVNRVTGRERLDAALKASEWIVEDPVAHFFRDEIKSWLALANEFDGDNAKGQYEAIFEVDWMSRLLQAGADENEQDARRIIAELARWEGAKKFLDPDRGARIHLIAGLINQNGQTSIDHLQKALSYEPRDAELRSVLLSLKRALEEFSSMVISSGSGFLVSRDGYILTNNHVIEGPGKPHVQLPGGSTTVPCRVIATDPRRDMALIKIDLPEGTALRPLPVTGKKLGRGVEVAAFGFPLGEAGLKLTVGPISGLPDADSDEMYVLDLRINPGNSGGPLCDKSGEVVGMVTAKTIGGKTLDSYGMALPAAELRTFLEKHIPDYAKSMEEPRESSGEWSDVDAIVSPCVMMVKMMAG